MLQWLRLSWSPFDLVILFLFAIFLLASESRLKWAIIKKKSTNGLSVAEKKPLELGVRNVPGPWSMPVLGTRWLFSVFGPYKLTKVHEAYKDMHRTYGSIFREEALWNIPVISVVDAISIQKVFKNSGRFPLRPPTEVTAYYRASRPDRYTNLGLINEQGEAWHHLRNLLTPELTSVKTVNRFLPQQNAICDDLISVIRRVRDEANTVIGFEELANRMGLEVVCSLILDKRMGFLHEEVDPLFARLADAVRDHFCASRDTFYGLPFWKVFPSKTYDDFVKSEELIYEIISDFVEKALEDEANTCNVSGVQSVFISILQTPGLDIRDKKAAIIDFIAAGITTLGNSVVFLLSLVAKRKDVQELLRAELGGAGVSRGGNITTDTLRNTEYLRACVLEAFRVLPTAPCVARILETDLQLGPYHFNGGTVILCHTWMACLEESNFSNSLDFKPERWLGEASRSNSNLALVAPFGHGRRMCPGKRFSEQGLHVVLAKLVNEFTIESDDEVEITFEFLLSPKGPINLRFIDRN